MPDSIFKAIVNDTSEFSIEKKGETFTLNGKETTLDISKISDTRFHLLRNNRSYNIEILEADSANKKYTVKVNDSIHTVQLKDKLDQLLHQLGMDKAISHKANDIKAPMPGLVLKVIASEGTVLKAGDSLLILEAMKMENIIKSSGEGIVGQILVKAGDKVEKGQILVKIS